MILVASTTHCGRVIAKVPRFHTEPIRRMLAWILYCNDVPDGGTEFHWQDHHVGAVKGTLAISPAGTSHIHRSRVSHEHTKTVATGWINAGSQEDGLRRLASSPAPPPSAR